MVYGIFFLFRSPKVSKFFGVLEAGTKSTKFPVLLPALYGVNLFIKLISNINFVFCLKLTLQTFPFCEMGTLHC